MTESATITFSQQGVQPPVYVVTSLSEPPWETLDMAVDKEQTASAGLVFSRRFEGVAAGSYQYKIRIGDGHWVVDESKDSATDEHGNRNNVLHVEPTKIHEQHKPKDTATEAPQTLQDESATSKDSRKDSTIDPSDAGDVPNVSVPVVVIDKVEDKEQSEHTDLGAPKLPAVHPIASSEGHRESGTEEQQAAPLFRHESFQDDEEASAPALDTIEEASVSEQTGSEIVNDTSSEYDESPRTSELDRAPTFSHETGEDDEDFDELNSGPLLSHETGLNGGIESSEEDVDELDAAPLLSHETGFSQYKGSEIVTNSDFTEDNISEPRHYMYEDDDEDDYRARSLQPDEAPTFTHEDSPNGEDDDDEYEEDDTPLLPHERDFAVAYTSSPEEDGQTTFNYEIGASADLFGRSGCASIFRNRANSSTLPHKMPRTDAEDENLADPSLERFPTHRAQILERVASIGLQMPEDQTMDDHIHSPVGSVLSQACSSVDLVPVKSYTSLASVPEAENSDEEDEYADSLPSPMVLNFGSASTKFAKDPHETPMANDSKRIGLDNEPSRKASVAGTTQSSDADSIAKTDGVKESALSKLHDAIATPTNVLSPITPPLTPEHKTEPSARPLPQSTEPQLRQRHVQKEDASIDPSTAPSEPVNHAQDTSNHTLTTANPEHLDARNETFLETFFRVVFGSVGRFLTACVGDRKRAGTAMVMVSVMTVAYYFLA